MATSYGIVKYRYHGEGDHFAEGHAINMIGIPDKPHTSGRQVFRKLGNQDTCNIILVDTSAQEVVGVFSTMGQAFTEDEETWSADPNVPDESWELRIFGKGYVNRANAIPLADLKARRKKGLRRGSFEFTEQADYEYIESRIKAQVV